MKTGKELEKDIIDITMKTHMEFPEMSKYIAEITVKISGNDTAELRTKNFKEYYNSLQDILVEYTKTHSAKHGKKGLGGRKNSGVSTLSTRR